MTKKDGLRKEKNFKLTKIKKILSLYLALIIKIKLKISYNLNYLPTNLMKKLNNFLNS